MNNKKKNGFTLIELLITISLMLSLLGIAIVSFISISNRKKQQAYEAVQKQAETAGEQFFDTNLYMFEGLAVNGTSGVITIGKLVSEDYLNVVTDPRTGKKINKCDYIQVTRTNSGYKTKYVETTAKSCPETLNTVVVQEAGAPSILLEINGTYNEASGWYYKAKPKEKATVKTNGNGPITEIKKCFNNGDGCNFNNSETAKNITFTKNTTITIDGTGIEDTSGSTISYKATNSSGKSAIATTGVKVDTEKPTVNAPDSSETWTNDKNKAFITFTINDSLSGIGKTTREWNEKSEDSYRNDGKHIAKESYDDSPKSKTLTPTINVQGRRKQRVTACDVAGNCSAAKEGYRYLDYTAPTITVYNSSEDAWTNQKANAYLKFTINDNASGIGKTTREWNEKSEDSYRNDGKHIAKESYDDSPKSKTLTPTINVQGRRKQRVTACDVAGNCSTKEGYKNYDATSPTCTSQINMNNDKKKLMYNGYYNKNSGVPDSITFTGDDGMSGIKGDLSITRKDITKENASYFQTFTDNAGNKTTCNVSILYDGGINNCKLTVSGTEGNNDWYISNVTVTLTKNNDDITSYGISTSKTATYNGKSSFIQTESTSGTTVYGYIKDKAGNTAKCDTTFKMDNEIPYFTFEPTPDRSKGRDQLSIYTGSGNSWVAKWPSGAPGWDPATPNCGISKCQDYEVMGCATDGTGDYWKHSNWTTKYLLTRCKNNYSDCLSSGPDSNNDKHYYKYKYRVCSNAGLCSNENFQIQHYYGCGSEGTNAVCKKSYSCTFNK